MLYCVYTLYALPIIITCTCSCTYMYVYACVFSQIEHDLLRSSFAALAQQMDLIFRKRLWFIMVEQFLMKYMWGLAGTCGTHTHTHTHIAGLSRLFPYTVDLSTCRQITYTHMQMSQKFRLHERWELMEAEEVNRNNLLSRCCCCCCCCCRVGDSGVADIEWSC